MGGLFLLSRRSQQGGGPGGNNPLNFGKSKAKFQMEPNTGITFDDVAGVDEAKQDFMEVGRRSDVDNIERKRFMPKQPPYMCASLCTQEHACLRQGNAAKASSEMLF